MSKKDFHYNIDDIDSRGALFNLIFGERSGRKKLSSET